MSKIEHSFSSLVNFTPVLLMMSLVLFSIVLVKQSPQAVIKSELKQRVNTAHDYYLQNFRTTRYDGTGYVNAHIRGERAEHFVQTEELAIQNINFLFFKVPNLYQGIASSGMINDATNSIQLYDKVSVTRRNTADQSMDATFESQFLKITTQPDMLVSDRPVKISNDHNVINANSLHYDSTSKIMMLNGSVKIKISRNK